ncbi:MAG: hypothetical protein AMS23_02005 [Bacteroides sp. SM1_62]|nr:MAG: hypothetical protein AMS26_16380 [Bacteroides sp. SM23_62]KPL26379.1 MAG: hypothetical protein AMS23_02005 [Bacteroides sp. SM1_62]
MMNIPPASLTVSKKTPINQVMLTRSKVLTKLCCHPDKTGFSADNPSALSEMPARFEMLTDEFATNSAGDETGWYAIKNVKRDEVKMAANAKTPSRYLTCDEISRRNLKISSNINPMIIPCHSEWKIVQPNAYTISSGMKIARIFIYYLFQFY